MKNLTGILISIVVVLTIFFLVFTRALSTYFSIQDAPELNSSHMRCLPYDEKGKKIKGGEPCAIWQTTITQLMARPEFFHGKIIEVLGYVHLEFEGNEIYAHKEDYDKALNQNGFWLDVPISTNSEECQDHYSLVRGKFNADRYGHGGFASGTIENITLCKWSR